MNEEVSYAPDSEQTQKERAAKNAAVECLVEIAKGENNGGYAEERMKAAKILLKNL